VVSREGFSSMELSGLALVNCIGAFAEKISGLIMTSKSDRRENLANCYT
jgi:hypothetical protein